MPLAPGVHLGPYQLVGSLGAGGMGEVYRATDTRLHRTVAIKVLPDSVARDEDRVTRFEQEARATAALNHPNIVALYDIGTADGVTYIVTELLAGETLRERVSHGALPVRKAIEIARQIASGLAAAHERGIVHRDLKPDNVFLTSDGYVKILDFGLAKLVQPAGAPAGSLVATAAAPQTGAGLMLGTIGYMAPEQVRGLEADHRADIFGFGALLYEMLGGVRPFLGATAADTLSAILSADPPPLTRADAAVPPALEALLRRCLEKQPHDRFQSARDLGFALETVTPLSGDASTIAAARPRGWHGRLRVVIVASALVVAVGAAALAWLLARSSSPPGPRLAVSILPPAQWEATGMPALAPDGRSLAFAAVDEHGVSRLFVRAFDSIESRQLAGTDGADQPFWSGDSRSVAFFARGKLWRADLSGGNPRIIATATDPRGGTWFGDVIVLARTGDDGLYKVNANGGTPAPLTKLDRGGQEISHRWPRFLPDGRHVLFMSRVAEAGPTRYIVSAASLDGSVTKRLVEAESTGIYVDGRLLVQRGATVLSQPFDAGTLELSGEPAPVQDHVWDDVERVAGLTGFDARQSVFAWRPAVTGTTRTSWVDRSGSVLGTLRETGMDDITLSPDGRTVAFNRADRDTGTMGLWLLDLERESVRRVSPVDTTETSAVWSPDGRRLAYAPVRSGTYDLFVKELTAGAPETQLLHSDRLKEARSWSPDGRSILFNTVGIDSGTDIWLLDVTGQAQPRLFAGGAADQRDAAFSPDGRWVAYVSSDSGRAEVYIRALDAGTPVQVSANGGEYPQWRADGGELYYLAADGHLTAVPITIAHGALEHGTPDALFRIRGARSSAPRIVMGAQRVYAVARDGKRFLVTQLPAESPASSINLLFNWTAKEARP